MDATMIVTVAAMQAGVVAILKMAFPAIPSRVIPLLVLVLSVIVVGVGVQSGEISGRPLALAIAVVQQVISAMGIREGVAAVGGQQIAAVGARLTGGAAKA